MEDMADSFSDPDQSRKIRTQFLIIEDLRDFIGWIFEEGLVDWMTQQEAYDKFQQWKENEDNNYQKENP